MTVVEYRGGPRAGTTATVTDPPAELPDQGGVYHLAADGRTYGWHVGEPTPDVVHVRPNDDDTAQVRPARRKVTRR